MVDTKQGVKKPRKRPSKAPKTAVANVIQRAGRRLELNPDQEECECARRAETSAPAGPFPSPEAGRWCVFCAIEAEQIEQGEPAGLYGEAVRHLAFEIDGEVYSDGEELDRDALVLGWWEEQPIETILETFAAAVARIEAAPRG